MTGIAGLVARDIMTSSLVCIGEQEELSAAAQRLTDAHVTGLPVVEDGRLVGIVSRSDCVRAPILLKTMDEYVSDRRHENTLQQEPREEFDGFRSRLRHLRVADVMTTEVETCLPDTPVEEIGTQMILHHIHRVVVVDSDRPVGIVGSLDLVKLLGR
jgi:CBS-domain-containing membrane protein